MPAGVFCRFVSRRVFPGSRVGSGVLTLSLSPGEFVVQSDQPASFVRRGRGCTASQSVVAVVRRIAVYVYTALTNQPMTDRDPTLPGAEARSDHDTPDVQEQPAGPHAAAHHFDVAAANSGQPALGGVAPPGGVAPAARSAVVPRRTSVVAFCRRRDASIQPSPLLRWMPVQRQLSQQRLQSARRRSQMPRALCVQDLPRRVFHPKLTTPTHKKKTDRENTLPILRFFQSPPPSRGETISRCTVPR